MDRQNRPLTILTIDDEEQIQYALRALFNSQGWEAISARDVEEGVGKFRTCRPDLVLMDYHLPKINGVKGVEMLRREDPEVPLIVFTIEDNQRVADQFLDAGASDFVLKPVKALDIIARIKLHVRLVESRRENRQSTEEPVKGIGQGTLSLIEGYLRSVSVPACGGHRGRDGAGLSDHLPISAISGVGESGGGEPALWKGGAPQTALPDDPGGGRRGKARNRTIMRDKKRRSAIGLAGAFSLSGTEKAVVKIDK